MVGIGIGVDVGVVVVLVMDLPLHVLADDLGLTVLAFLRLAGSCIGIDSRVAVPPIRGRVVLHIVGSEARVLFAGLDLVFVLGSPPASVLAGFADMRLVDRPQRDTRVRALAAVVAGGLAAILRERGIHPCTAHACVEFPKATVQRGESRGDNGEKQVHLLIDERSRKGDPRVDRMSGHIDVMGM